MSLTHIVLGWLSYEPMTGYDLNAVIEISTQHFWTTSQSQIYRTLAKIEQEGWVTQEVIHQEDRPLRKVYHITDSGLSELKRWLSIFHDPEQPRLPWLIQVFFAGQISDEKIVAVLEKKASNLQRRLARIRAARDTSAEQISPEEDLRDVFYWLMTIDYGESQLQSQIAWIKKTILRIKDREYAGWTLEVLKESKTDKEKSHE